MPRTFCHVIYLFSVPTFSGLFFFVPFDSPTSIKRNFDSPKRCIQRFYTRTLNDNGGIAVYTLQCQRSISLAYRVD